MKPIMHVWNVGYERWWQRQINTVQWKKKKILSFGDKRQIYFLSYIRWGGKTDLYERMVMSTGPKKKEENNVECISDCDCRKPGGREILHLQVD